MVAKLQAPVEICGCDRNNMAGTGLLFFLQDVAALESTAGQQFPDWQDPDNPRRGLRFELRRRLHQAFLDAHLRAGNSRDEPAPSEIREAFDKVARAGRQFLLSLGVEVIKDRDPARLVGKNSIEIATSSGILRALVDRVEIETNRLTTFDLNFDLPWAGTDERITPSQPAELADNERIVEAVRCVGFVVAGAEGAMAEAAKERRQPGPIREVFGPALMDGLVNCYELMFGEAPVLMRKDNYRSGDIDFDPHSPALLWLRLALQRALSSLTGPRPDLMEPASPAIIEAGTVTETAIVAAIPVARRLSAATVACKFTGSEDLAAAVGTLVSRDDQYLAKLFHKAIRKSARTKTG
jgi:hypothetical protein